METDATAVVRLSVLRSNPLKNMIIPNLTQARAYLDEAHHLNPGPWYSHSLYVAEGAKLIATYHADLDPDAAYILGLLHDIGRRCGVTSMRHVIDGYNFLHDEGYEDAARISLTHSFPIKDAQMIFGAWDCSQEELKFVDDYLASIEYDDYDRLLQLCDTLALPSGFCLMEKRFIDVALRYGVSDIAVPKWKKYFEVRDYFERIIGQSIYEVLPNVAENTFGFNGAGAQHAAPVHAK